MSCTGNEINITSCDYANITTQQNDVVGVKCSQGTYVCTHLRAYPCLSMLSIIIIIIIIIVVVVVVVIIVIMYKEN